MVVTSSESLLASSRTFQACRDKTRPLKAWELFLITWPNFGFSSKPDRLESVQITREPGLLGTDPEAHTSANIAIAGMGQSLDVEQIKRKKVSVTGIRLYHLKAASELKEE